MPDSRGRRLVPRWFDRGSGIEGLAARLDWRPVVPAEDDGWEEGWEASPETRVTWWEDGETGIQYALVEGPDAPAVEAAIRDALDILRPETYAAAVAAEGTPMGRGHLLLAVAVDAPTPDDPAARAVLMEALADANPFVRRYASLAAGALGSDQLLAVVAKLAATDPDPDVRVTAAEVGDSDRG